MLVAQSNLMSTSQDRSAERYVELEASEFAEVYALLKTCITAEMGLEASEEIDGEQLVNSCHRILDRGLPCENQHYDMSRGFVPLFERLHNAKGSPVNTDDGLVYRVSF